MKIALCFSGQARSFERGYDFYRKNLLDHYDVDLYIHTWTFDKSQDLLNLYNPKNFLIEDQPETNANDLYTNTPNPVRHPPKNTYNMLLSMYKSSILINGEYDWVIKSRTDYALNGIIPFNTLDRNKLYIPNCHMVPTRDFGNDQFAFSSQENMLKYMSTFCHLDEYYNAGTTMIGEHMMRANLHKHNLFGDNLLYVNMNNPFPPGPYNGTWHSLIRDDYDNWANNR